MATESVSQVCPTHCVLYEFFAAAWTSGVG